MNTLSKNTMNETESLKLNLGNYSEEKVQETAQLITDFLKSGLPLYRLKGMKPEDMNYIYAIGYNYYLSGKYEKASEIFCFCTMFDSLNREYWMALGGARQMNKQYEEAVQCYFMVTTLKSKEPLAYYEMGKCLLKLGMRSEAEDSLNKAIERFQKYPEMAPKMEAAMSLLSLIQENSKE